MSILEDIDHAVRHYSVSDDAMRWRPDPKVRPFVAIDPSGSAVSVVPVRAVANLTPEQRAEQREAVLAMYREAGRRLGEVLEEFFGMVHDVVTRFEANTPYLFTAGVIRPALPEDPMERALELRRNRNTGPVVPMHVPRRIDPVRGHR